MSGCNANALAIATRCFWPPESSFGKLFILSDNPTKSSIFLVIASASDVSIFFTSFKVFTILFLTDRWGNKLKVWKTIPVFSSISFLIFLSTFLSVRLFPSIKISPDVIDSKSTIQRKIVDFPLPEGPINETTSPLLIYKFISFKIILSPYCFFKFFTSTIFSFFTLYLLVYFNFKIS